MSKNLGEPRVTDYCRACGHSPESAVHWVGPGQHEYQDPRLEVDADEAFDNAPTREIGGRFDLTDCDGGPK